MAILEHIKNLKNEFISEKIFNEFIKHLIESSKLDSSFKYYYLSYL